MKMYKVIYKERNKKKNFNIYIFAENSTLAELQAKRNLGKNYVILKTMLLCINADKPICPACRYSELYDLEDKKEVTYICKLQNID